MVDSDLLLVVAVVVTADNSDNDNGKNGTKITFVTYIGHVTSSNPIIYYLFCRVWCIREDGDLLLVVVVVVVTAYSSDNDNGKNGTKMTFNTKIQAW